MIPLTLIEQERINNASHHNCGPCKACCIPFPVPEVGKPYAVECPHLTEEGCGIYNDRPERCKSFSCLYLTGNLNGDERMRPDNLGVIFYYAPFPKIGHILAAQEIWENATASERVQHLFRRIGKERPILVFKWGYTPQDYRKRELIGPPAAVRMAEQLLPQLTLSRL